MENRLLLDVKELAELLGISTRQVWRLRDAGAMPMPLSLGDGRCLRWNGEIIKEWLTAGAPHCRRTGWKMKGRNHA